MDRDSRQRAKLIFAEAADLRRPSERAEYLDRACGADEDVRNQVEALLAAHDRAVRPGGAGSPTDAGAARFAPDAAPTASVVSEQPGSRIGPYKLLQQIGEGGFGVVFMAEQDQPVVRCVALKIIKLGMDTRQVIARFEAERQALAMMDHPNIARVLDAGATETGRPYFVMELVRGDPITEYCDRNNLSTAERLSLFTDVCHAVQHAHQKGIIHRDLKPSNVLVTMFDGRPIPKVIDFGIAKATIARLTEKTLFTEHRTLIGTPEYMSPEQAEMSGVDIDTRSDIYSLGVLLYELLTGTTPFDPTALRSAAFGELQRIIREVEPDKPSTRLGTLKETIPRIAAQRHTDPAHLSRCVRGDLDWIVMRCLEKDRTRRYETANGLAMDVQRHLAGEAVLAAPPSAAYRVRKFARRHRGPVAAGGLVAGVLVLGVIGTTIGMVRARRASAAEAAQRLVAEAERARASTTAEFLAGILEGAGPSKARGRDTTMLAEMLDRAKEKIEGGGLRDTPAADIRLRRTIAETYGSIGRLTESEAMLVRALELAETTWPGDEAEKAEVLNDLGYARQALGRPAEAEPLYRRSLEMRQRVFRGDHRAIAESLNNMGYLMHALHQSDKELDYHQQALDMKRRLYAGDDPDLVLSLNNVAAAKLATNNPDDAERLLSQAMEMMQRIQKGDHPDLAQLMNNVAFLRQSRGHADAAEPLYQQALEMRRRLYKEDCPELAESLSNLASVKRALGEPATATRLFQEVLDMRRRLYKGADHPDLALSLANLAGAARDAGDSSRPGPLLSEAWAMVQRLKQEQTPLGVVVQSGYGRCLVEQGKTVEGLKLAEGAAAAAARLLPEGHSARKECDANLAAARAMPAGPA